MTSQEIKALTGQYIMNTYGRFPVAIDHGQGATLYDPEGNAYIDFTSGIGVSDLGYGFVPENFNAYVVDNVVAVNTTDAQRAAQKVLRTDAIPASVASGAVLQAAAQLIHVGASRSALAILPGRQLINTL